MPEARERAVSHLLDTLIPPEGPLPGAGELGLGGQLLAENPLLGPALLELSGEDAGDHDALCAALEQRHPGLLPGLIFRTYTLYYQHPRVAEALGLEARPPFPLGYALEPGDLGGLEAVRSRKKLYRDC